ncbi:MAG: hypothetical protein ACRDRW_20345 [Pseudonocardiaceae bacterium]
MARSKIDGVMEDLDAAMQHLRSTLHGIPIRQGSFRVQHDTMAREVAHLLV